MIPSRKLRLDFYMSEKQRFEIWTHQTLGGVFVIAVGIITLILKVVHIHKSILDYEEFLYFLPTYKDILVLSIFIRILHVQNIWFLWLLYLQFSLSLFLVLREQRKTLKNMFAQKWAREGNKEKGKKGKKNSWSQSLDDFFQM